MTGNHFTWTGHGALEKRLARIAGAGQHAGPLMDQWADIATEDNRKGVLLGTGGDDQPLARVTYRLGLTQARVKARGGAAMGLTVGSFKGIDGHRNGNLTSAEYRKLSGPPLAPRGQQSRSIANYFGKISHSPAMTHWEVETAWLDIVNAKGVPFFHYLLDGTTGMPARDLRGLRAWGRSMRDKALSQWIDGLLSG